VLKEPIDRREFLRYGAMGIVAVTGVPRLRTAARSRAGSQVARCVIHPAFGIARVGNSPDGFLLGPEVPGTWRPAGRFRDNASRLYRQAARFRVFGLDENDRIVGEITLDQAEIVWTVHVANAKGSWYAFLQALDIPESQNPPLVCPRRNGDVVDRSSLVIDPGPRSVGGSSTNPRGTDPSYRLDGGTFMGVEIPLGDVRTDSSGRLLVLGGFGHSGSVDQGARATSYANNDRWYDDVSDGPVDAIVRIDGRDVPVTGAWVVVAPPDYAPGVQSVLTMYDVMYEAATRLPGQRKSARPSFTRQIYPLLERHVANQWVNAGFAKEFGWGAPSNFLSPAMLAKLGDPGVSARSLRRQVFARFRNPSFATMQPKALPPYYGDAAAFPPVSPRQWLAVLPMQYEWLRQWTAGDFDADWPAGGVRTARSLEELPLAERPAALDRAALDECLGGPFHPGCEMTWPMRNPAVYSEPFRLRRREQPAPDWGGELTPSTALAPSGPLHTWGPGDVTRWLAVPWQADTASCLSAYDPAEGEFLPTFWPARVPNDVLTWESYKTLLDPRASSAAKKAAFERRVKWLRNFPPRNETTGLIDAFISNWAGISLVTHKPGPGGDFPKSLWVEAEQSEDGRGR